MTPEERARALRQEADSVLDLIRLRELCAPIGRLIPTGSYFMDLMVYPDVDLYLPPTTPERLLSVGVELSKHDRVQRINYMRGGPGDLKDGLYLKPVVEHGNWERPWKIDIWCVAEAVVRKKQAELGELKNRMTPGHRATILAAKYHLLNDAGRTPMFSGVYIYKAVIDHGLRETDEIVKFLVEHGIEL